MYSFTSIYIWLEILIITKIISQQSRVHLVLLGMYIIILLSLLKENKT